MQIIKLNESTIDTAIEPLSDYMSKDVLLELIGSEPCFLVVDLDDAEVFVMDVSDIPSGSKFDRDAAETGYTEYMEK